MSPVLCRQQLQVLPERLHHTRAVVDRGPILGLMRRHVAAATMIQGLPVKGSVRTQQMLLRNGASPAAIAIATY